MLKSFFKRRPLPSSHRPYILPTIYGLAYAFCCFLILLMAFLFLNNLVYLVCFLMIGFATASLVQTNRNIEIAELLKMEMEPGFEDEKKPIYITLKNKSDANIHDLEIEYLGSKKKIPEIKGHETRRIELVAPGEPLGIKNFSRLQVQSSFPFDISRSWKNMKFEASYYVFPKPEGLDLNSLLYSSNQHDQQDTDYFRGHHRYNSTDNPKSIDWKVYGRTRTLLVKEFESPSELEIKIRASDCPLTEQLARKRQLSKWLTEADKNGFKYSLVLPFKTIEVGRGADHLTTCMKALVDGKV